MALRSIRKIYLVGPNLSESGRTPVRVGHVVVVVSTIGVDIPCVSIRIGVTRASPGIGCEWDFQHIT